MLLNLHTTCKCKITNIPTYWNSSKVYFHSFVDFSRGERKNIQIYLYLKWKSNNTLLNFPLKWKTPLFRAFKIINFVLSLFFVTLFLLLTLYLSLCTIRIFLLLFLAVCRWQIFPFNQFLFFSLYYLIFIIIFIRKNERIKEGKKLILSFVNMSYTFKFSWVFVFCFRLSFLIVK